jgi:cytoskeletal protein CcmA (bactofilin family)
MDENKKNTRSVVTLSETTTLHGTMKFRQTLCIRGKFSGVISSDDGTLVIDPGAEVSANSIAVTNCTVYGKLTAPIKATNRIDFRTGAEVTGDIEAGALRIADGVHFEGKCSMVTPGKENVEIFARPIADIKADLRQA